MQAAAQEKLQATIAPVFNGDSAAGKFDYEAEVRNVWEMFPETRDKLFFVDLLSNRVVYPDSHMMEHGLTQWLRSDAGLQAVVREFRDDRKSSCCLRVGNDKRCVLLYTAESPSLMQERFFPLDQATTFTLDHEVAHAVIRDATAAVHPSLAECIADAYATIRHFQRYGADSTTIDGMAGWRAARFVFANLGNDRGKIHFTSPVIEQVLARRHDIDWEKLTPKETADLARRFGLMYAPHPILLERFDEHFRQCHTPENTVPKGDAATITRLLDILETSTFPVFVKYGAMALKFCSPEADQLPGLDEARRRIERRAERLENMDDILSGFEDKARRPLQPRRGGVIANQP